MHLIEQQYLEIPFYGSRRMAAHLQAQGHLVNHKQIARLMRLMGTSYYPRPKICLADR
ncbi:MAG: transposase [Candidatus Kapaibacterium sp.]|nr:MAG: transposase [Candidatus Kapabacteria bacterium]